MLLLTVSMVPASEVVWALRFVACISLFFTALSMSLLLISLGACNALPKRWNYCPVHEDEPCPRAVRWTYPENLEPGKRHWFLVHVAETKLLDQHYVASISQYVGARGTSGAKLMLISCTSVAVCQVTTAFLLWRVEVLTNSSGVSLLRCSLMWLAAVALILLGLAESAIDWKSPVKVAKDPPSRSEIGGRTGGGASNGSVNGRGSGPLRSKMDEPVEVEAEVDGEVKTVVVKPAEVVRKMSLVAEEDEAVGKSTLRLLHMLAAFAVVGLNVAAQWMGGDAYSRPVSAGSAAVGGTVFFVFCMMQWLSGANDTDIPDYLANYRGSAVAYSFCACLRPICYCPPGFQNDSNIEALLTRLCDRSGKTSPKRSALICASWWFISIEVVAFVALTSCTAMEALTKQF